MTITSKQLSGDQAYTGVARSEHEEALARAKAKNEALELELQKIRELENSKKKSKQKKSRLLLKSHPYSSQNQVRPSDLLPKFRDQLLGLPSFFDKTYAI